MNILFYSSFNARARDAETLMLAFKKQGHRVVSLTQAEGKPINDGVRMATSTLMGIMGRMAAYTGQEVTWEQAMQSKEQLVPDPIDWTTPMPITPVAIPGKTRLI